MQVMFSKYLVKLYKLENITKFAKLISIGFKYKIFKPQKYK